MPIEVLKFDPKSSVLILQVPSTWSVKARAALTLQSSFQGAPCAYRVVNASQTLLGLA